jgi:type I restriction enzyme, R subunit
MSEDMQQHIPAEKQARVLIDEQLAAAGWVVQDRKDLNFLLVRA